jgi:hypothetical protein
VRRSGRSTSRTLLVGSNGAGWQARFADTLVRGVLRIREGSSVERRLRESRLLRRLFGRREVLVDYMLDPARYGAQGYMRDWEDAFRRSPLLDADFVSVTDAIAFAGRLRRLREYDLIVILHSATGDDLTTLLRLAPAFDRRRAPLLVLVGNEYNLLDHKVELLHRTGAEFVGTQLPLAAGQWLYADAKPTRVLAAPHALNPLAYAPPPAGLLRPIDVGFVGALYPHSIGDRSRTDAILWFRDEGPRVGLNTDIRFAKLPQADWAGFLRRCRAVVGAESGTQYLDRTGDLIREVDRWVAAHPDASFEAVHARFFSGLRPAVSGKAISSRHFEPIGTGTAQVLVRGEYNGILQPDEHYLPLDTDLGNVHDVIARLQDEPARQELADRTYEYALAHHTYDHRVTDLVTGVWASR